MSVGSVGGVPTGSTSPTVWCVGAGAIGGNVASRLVLAGLEPLVVDADPRHVALLREPGLAVESPGGDRMTPMDAVSPEAALSREGRCDLLLLAVRSQVTESALAPLLSRLAPNGDVVSLQNGLSCERVATIAGEQRTIGCAVGFAATYLAPGRVRLDAEGPLTIGRLWDSGATGATGGTGEDSGLARSSRAGWGVADS
ncbi:MAG: 2-dehydropantoate 2-reductase [Acidimicrobiia bacterium]|nr:2-dehydropantoate 2-reductase [Acidimicrobiia bacterium]